MSHPFGELLTQYRIRKRGLSQARLAQIVGYDPAVIARMAQGTRDLTGPSGRERVVRILTALHDEGVLRSLDEANALLVAADMPPLYDGLPAEASLIRGLSPASASAHTNSPTLATPPYEGVPHNLPALLTSFIGREQEIVELAARIQTTRLLTLTGAGGVGKSRLAQQLAGAVLNSHHARADLAGGAWLVQLAPINEPALVADAIASILGLRPSGRPAQDVLIEYLQSKRLLIILDNCEHLIHACAELAETLLHVCPHLRILATSRESLNIAGEVTWRVPSLTNETALRLFTDRASAARPDFRLNEHNATLIAHICARLDGIPLAIELAAARLRAFSVEQIAARLDDRFRLLTSGKRTALPRHRTLRAMIDWSYELLPDQERGMLRQVSIFAGGWTLESAEFMFGNAEALDVLAQLVGKSLVNMNDTSLGVRYGLHETIRQYAHEKLAESGDLVRTKHRHAEACLALILYGKEHLRFKDQKRWVAALESEHDNIRAALTWSLSESGDPSLGLHIAAYAGEFWLQSHRIEGYEWTRRLLERVSDSTPFKVRGMMMIHYAYLTDAAPSKLRSYLQQLWELYAREDPEHNHTVEILGYLAILAETAEAGTALLDEALALSRKSSHPDARYWIHYFLGLHLGPMGWKLDIAGAKAAFEDLLAEAIRQRDPFGQALAHEGLMKVAFYEMHFAQAADLARQTMLLAEQVNAETCILNSLHCLAEIELIEGRLDVAKAYIDASDDHNMKYGYTAVTVRGVGLRMRLALAMGDHASVCALSAELRRYASMPEVPTLFGLNVSIVYGLETLAALKTIEGQHTRAAQIFGVVEAERERRHDLWWPKDHTQLDPHINASRRQLGEQAFAAAWAKGRAMTLDEAVEYALVSL